MRHIYDLTAPLTAPAWRSSISGSPATGARPLAGCQAGTIIYVFTPGEVTVCPYLVFAARTPQSRHDPAEFIVGNIFADADIAARLDDLQFARATRWAPTRPAVHAACRISAARDARPR